jgi:FAD/FMN-containing dehydrogenase
VGKVDEQRIGDIVGADNVSITHETCMIYSKDVTSLPDIAYQIVSPKFDIVTQPVDVPSLQNLVGYAIDNNIPIVPRGNGTSGWGGSIPTRGGICIGLSGMSGVLYFNEFEQAVTVESGITWRDLLAFLERLGYTLPVYPSSATAATVGGFVASGGLGIGSTRHGDILKQVLGIEAVLPNGKVVRLGRVLLDPKTDETKEKALKGNKWLEMELEAAGLGTPEQETRLLTGTYGTLGIITKVSLKTIPNLQLVPFASSFNSMKDLVNAAARMINETQPYFLRFLADNYTSKLRAIAGNKLEQGKYVLMGALLDTIYNNEDNIAAIQTITEEGNGIRLDDKRAWFYWNERLYPLRIKRYGPSLVPAEMLAPLDKLPEILEETKVELRNSNVAIEGTMNNDNSSSFMVWILDDERRSFSFTVGWQRSFRIAALAQRFGGLPYAVGLWNGRHAREYYGNKAFNNLKIMKKRLDPRNLMNPVKVFGGRVTAGRASKSLGFMAGFVIAFLMGLIGPELIGWTWLAQIMSLNLIQFVPVPILIWVALLGGLLGFSIVYFMTINQALSIGIPVLRFLSKLMRR